jgi:spore maturation protein CgeB
MGYEIEEVRQDLESYDISEEFSEFLEKKLKSTVFDFVFTINYFPVISDVCQRVGILYIAWSCDSPLISMYHKSVFNDVNRIFTFDMTNYR